MGQLPDIQVAADSDRIVEYAQQMSREFGLLQTQIVGPICHMVVYDPEVCRHIFTSKAGCYHKASDSQKEIMRQSHSRSKAEAKSEATVARER